MSVITRSRSVQVGLVAAVTATSLFTAAPALAAKAPVRTAISAHLSPGTALVKTPALVSGTVSPKGGTLVLQRLVGKKWTTVAHQKSTTAGAFSFKLHAPKAAATWPLRVTRAAGKTTKAGVSSTLTLHAVSTGYVVVALASSSVTAPAPVTLAGAVVPRAAGSVQLQQLTGTTWITVATAKLTATSTFSVSTNQPAGPVRLRVVKGFTTHIAAGTSPPVTVTVAPQPFPSVATVALPMGRVGLPYAAVLSASGGTGSYAFTATGLPSGLALSSAGALTGTPLVRGTTTVTVAVADGAGQVASRTLSILVGAPAGRLLSVGANLYGQLGNGTTTDAHTVVPVSGQLNAVAVAGGSAQGYSADADGSVWAWGYNFTGKLGTGDTTTTTVPVPVAGLTGVTQIAALSSGAMALRADGTVWAWGTNAYGQVGDGTMTSRLAAVQVVGLTSVVAIAAGDFSAYALRSDGTVWSWGYGLNDELGDGTATSRMTAGQIPGLTGVVQIASGISTGYALRSDGVVESWGTGNAGELGTGTTSPSSHPVVIAGLTGVVAIAAGDSNGYALSAAGTVSAWGNGGNGGLGTGSLSSSIVPVAVHNVSGAVAIVGTGSGVGAITATGSVWMWGGNTYGQRGDGTITTGALPVQLIGVPKAVALGNGRDGTSTYLIE